MAWGNENLEHTRSPETWGIKETLNVSSGSLAEQNQTKKPEV